MSITKSIKTNQPVSYRELLTHELKGKKFKKEWDADAPARELGRQIIEARIKQKLTQQDLAKKAGTTQAVISRIESMKVSPSLQLASRIAQAFGKKIEIRFV